MVPRARLAAIDAALPFEEVLGSSPPALTAGCPVYRGSIDNIVGILHTKDVVTRYVQAGGLIGRLAPAADRAACPTRCRPIAC